MGKGMSAKQMSVPIRVAELDHERWAPAIRVGVDVNEHPGFPQGRGAARVDAPGKVSCYGPPGLRNPR